VAECDWCRWQLERSLWHPAYTWVEEEVGYYPVFLAVGAGMGSQRQTGYARQWKRELAEAKDEFSDRVLFTWSSRPHEATRHMLWEPWDDIVQAMIAAYDSPHDTARGWRAAPGLVLQARREFEEHVLSPRERERMWACERTDRGWLRVARRPGTVQAVAPELDLRTADLVRCRSQRSRRELIEKGFDERSLLVERWPVSAA
jgi:hypothetical protein